MVSQEVCVAGARGAEGAPVGLPVLPAELCTDAEREVPPPRACRGCRGGREPASDLEASVPSKQAASQDDRLSGLDGKDLEHHCRTMLQLPEHSPGGPALRRYPHRADHQHIFVAGKFWALREAGGETAARTDGSNLYE